MKFSDSGRLNAIKGVIDELREKGLSDLDVDYVSEICKKYEKELRLPEYTTDDGVNYLTKSIVSLDFSMISDAFVSNCSGLGQYSFTLSVNEYFANGMGLQFSVVKFSASLPQFNTECFNFRIGLCLTLVDVSFVLYPCKGISFELGVLIGFGAEAGFFFNFSLTTIESGGRGGFIAGVYFLLKLNLKELLNLT